MSLRFIPISLHVGITGKLKYVTVLCLVMVFGLQDSVNANGCTTAEEVVSIYGANFNTPKSREPYFVRIQRCVMGNNNLPCWFWSVPRENSRKEVEIVVPDINDKTKFYKYVVYNDTACECQCSGAQNSVTQHKRLASHEVNETEFTSKLAMNPENLRACNRSAYCSKPQPRYVINTWGVESEPQWRYIKYHQCLPGCKSTTTISEYKFENLRGEPARTQTVSEDLACSPYVQEKPGERATLINGRSPNDGSLEASDETKPQNEMIIYIGSTKLLLAAFVLSTILLSILIVDCNLWHRKKGILYNILCCQKYRREMDCQDCAERRQMMIDV
ncbi:Hypothetical predicted protein [Paramuricea clavata]|uniref:Uncharacterized protein n=1 Tax=Paramuricea clavata TaxID=317549 RepID=A0A6S7JLY9_PARCT|nr:Hypothetical predicted protein [Paramuricea clavata]